MAQLKNGTHWHAFELRTQEPWLLAYHSARCTGGYSRAERLSFTIARHTPHPAKTFTSLLIYMLGGFEDA